MPQHREGDVPGISHDDMDNHQRHDDAREVTPVGDDTLFASMYAAYDALSDGLRQTRESMRACHSSG